MLSKTLVVFNVVVRLLLIVQACLHHPPVAAAPPRAASGSGGAPSTVRVIDAYKLCHPRTVLAAAAELHVLSRPLYWARLLLCAKLISFAAVLIRQKRRLNFRHQTKRSVFDKVPTSYSTLGQPAWLVACFCLLLLIAPLKVEQLEQGTKLAEDNYCTKAAL